jgi:hypothetical protein
MAGGDMSDILDDESIGLDDADIQAMAKRQLAASTAVAIVIALGAIVMAMAPSSRNDAGVATHRVANIQRPKFSAQTIGAFAVGKQEQKIELP